MKKILVLVIAALALAAPRAQAQDMFNHMALGATLGVDGIGLDLAMPMGSKFQLRAGGAFDPFSISFNQEVSLGSFGSGGKTINLNNVPLTASTLKAGSAHLMADFYPSKGGFHISAGVFFNIRDNGKLISAKADLSKVLDKQNWGVGIGPEGGFTVSTDEAGQLMMDIKTWAVNPYVGIGFGRALNPEKTFNFVFDMGLMVLGASLHGYNYSKHIFDESKPVEDVLIKGDDVQSLNAQAADLLNLLGVIPVPYIRFGFYFKLF